MLLIVTAQAQFCLEGNSIGKTSLHTLFDGVAGRVNEIIKELQHEDIPCIIDGEVLLENLEKTFVVTLIRRGLKLKIILERLDLNL